jgi:hypothetical protein
MFRLFFRAPTTVVATPTSSRTPSIVSHRIAQLALLLVAVLGTSVMRVSAQAFDHSHAAFTALLKKHVVAIDGGKATQVHYAALQRDRAELKTYLTQLSGVSESQFNTWPRAERMAFLINAYNAFTLELMVANYPVKSIKDIGGTFDNRWKRKFIRLLGNDVSLDWIEHDTLRKPGAYDDVRVHYAVNCASIGCPALRAEAFVAARLDAQLEEQAVRFLSDRSRNRWRNDRLEVSMIYRWFRDDWERVTTGFDGKSPATKSREAYFARYAHLLADNVAEQQKIATANPSAVNITHLDYDWSINDRK